MTGNWSTFRQDTNGEGREISPVANAQQSERDRDDRPQCIRNALSLVERCIDSESSAPIGSFGSGGGQCANQGLGAYANANKKAII